MGAKPLPSNTDDMIAEVRETIRQKMVDFDRWLTENPQAVQDQDMTFRARKHELKLLKLRLNELLQLQERYIQDSVFFGGAEKAPEPQLSNPRGVQPSKTSRTIRVTDGRRHLKVAGCLGEGSDHYE